MGRGYFKYELCKREAKNDAALRASPRGPTKFVCPETKVCRLCGCGLGKQCSKAERQCHQTGNEHSTKYLVYVEIFHELRQVRLGELDESNKTAQLSSSEGRIWKLHYPGRCLSIRHLYNLPRPFPPNVADWINVPGNLVPLKVAIADLLMSQDPDPLYDRAGEELRKHVYYARILLCHRIAAAKLPDNAHSAHTVATLLIPLVTSSFVQ